MVGQTHVLKALINALDSQRLHHAYLFTGTRGVGKTTIARIIAKCLNCETGITSSPCGECSVCREIDEGRFVDLIEIDAASRTKVEDTRELLDNVQYAPSRGRFKVYLIDEVHMLSSHSFNALLKTLEEPPPYVKFILATTDPQKLPATILSRCLQFSLKNMTPERVVEHLTHVLTAENVPFEDDALWLLGRAADGSMRDAMSLTDQAIAFGEGKVLATDVRAMLGTLDHGQVYDVLHALIEGDAKALLEAVRHLAEQGPDWNGVLSEILNVLHRVAIAQALPEGVDNGHGDRDRVLALAQALPAEDVQFYYQMGLIGRRDLPLAPDPRGGFEMVLLRMLAFRPADTADAPRQPLKPVGISQATVDFRKLSGCRAEACAGGRCGCCAHTCARTGSGAGCRARTCGDRLSKHNRSLSQSPSKPWSICRGTTRWKPRPSLRPFSNPLSNQCWKLLASSLNCRRCRCRPRTARCRMRRSGPLRQFPSRPSPRSMPLRRAWTWTTNRRWMKTTSSRTWIRPTAISTNWPANTPPILSLNPSRNLPPRRPPAWPCNGWSCSRSCRFPA